LVLQEATMTAMHFGFLSNPLRWAARKLSLLTRFALTSLAVFVLIGFALIHTIGAITEQSALSAAKAAAFDNFNVLKTHLTPADLQGGLTGSAFRRFDQLVGHLY
jgi:hypothetical protein